MAPDDLNKRTAQILGSIHALSQECRILDQRRHLLAPLIQNHEINEALKRKLENTPGVAAWNHLAPLLGQDLVRDQSRLFLDQDKKSGSLTNLWAKLRADSAIKTHFRDAYARLADHHQVGAMESLSERRDNRAYFDEAWGRIGAFVEGFKSDPVAAKIKQLRDKYHAHLEMAKLGEEPAPFNPNSVGLTFEDVFAFNDAGQQIVSELGTILTREGWFPRQYAEVHAAQGIDMWMRLAQ